MLGQTTFGQTTPRRREEKSKYGGTGIVLQSRSGVTSIAHDCVSETLIIFADRPGSGPAKRSNLAAMRFVFQLCFILRSDVSNRFHHAAGLVHFLN
jgi:hypothetical protein